MDLALNDLQWLICHKTRQTKPNHPFPGLVNFSLDPYPIILRVNQGGNKYHFF